MTLRNRLISLVAAACAIQGALWAAGPAAAQSRPSTQYWGCNYWDSKNKIGYYSDTASVTSSVGFNETEARSTAVERSNQHNSAVLPASDEKLAKVFQHLRKLCGGPDPIQF